METLLRDVRFGLRVLRKNVGYTATALVALALGIGANAAIFSVVNALLLRPLPYIDSHRLVVVDTGDREIGADQFQGMSPADFWDYKDQSETFEQLACYSGGGFSLTGVENPESFPGTRVSPNYFDMLKARPLLGRTFSDEDGLAKSPDTIILSYRLWQRYFGGDESIVGKTLGDTGTEVIGVMQPDFKWPDYAECWIPLSRDSFEMRNRANRYFSALGLIRADQSLGSAETQLKTVATRLEASYPSSNRNIGVRLSLFREAYTRTVRSSFLILLGAVGFVLLIACANVANLLLARAAGRRREMAIRLAVGARRSSLIRQLLVESAMLGLAGGALGVMLAMWGVDLLVRLRPRTFGYLRLEDFVRIDASVLAFTLIVSVLTGLLFGFIPALQSSKPDLNEWLKEGRGSDGLRHRRWRSGLVVSEIAMAIVLLSGAGLLIKSFLNLQHADLGLEPRNLIGMSFEVSPRKYPNDEARVRFVRQVMERLERVHGVESVAATSGMLFPFLTFNFNIEGRPMPADADAMYDSVSPNYFRTMKARLVSGREFDERDKPNLPRAAIVNETLARRFFGGEDPLGKGITLNYLGQNRSHEIVGVVKDMNQGQGGRIIPHIFVSCDQSPWLSSGLIVRTSSDLAGVHKELQQALWEEDRAQPAARFSSAEILLSTALSEPRFYTVLLGFFAGLALFLSAIGIYGVLSYSVAQRTREIGIRMALGGRRADVFKLVVGEGLLLASLGVGTGLAAALGLTRLLSNLLFGVTASDPVTFATIVGLLFGVALLACYLPARRAARVDPMVALRYE